MREPMERFYRLTASLEDLVLWGRLHMAQSVEYEGDAGQASDWYLWESCWALTTPEIGR